MKPSNKLASNYSSRALLRHVSSIKIMIAFIILNFLTAASQVTSHNSQRVHCSALSHDSFGFPEAVKSFFGRFNCSTKYNCILHSYSWPAIAKGEKMTKSNNNSIWDQCAPNNQKMPCWRTETEQSLCPDQFRSGQENIYI